MRCLCSLELSCRAHFYQVTLAVIFHLYSYKHSSALHSSADFHIAIIRSRNRREPFQRRTQLLVASHLLSSIILQSVRYCLFLVLHLCGFSLLFYLPAGWLFQVYLSACLFLLFLSHCTVCLPSPSCQWWFSVFSFCSQSDFSPSI